MLEDLKSSERAVPQVQPFECYSLAAGCSYTGSWLTAGVPASTPKLTYCPASQSSSRFGVIEPLKLLELHFRVTKRCPRTIAMDPVSGAIGVADVSVRLVKYLIEFREEMGSIDEGLDNLIQRIEGLTDLLLTIDAIKQPGTIPVDNPNKAEGISNLWMHLDRALANCREVLLKLEEMVQGIRGESVKQESRKFDTVRKVLRKRLKDSDLRVCQSQLAMHQDTLQVVVNIITMYVTVLCPREVN